MPSIIIIHYFIIELKPVFLVVKAVLVEHKNASVSLSSLANKLHTFVACKVVDFLINKRDKGKTKLSILRCLDTQGQESFNQVLVAVEDIVE